MAASTKLKQVGLIGKRKEALQKYFDSVRKRLQSRYIPDTS